MRVLLRILSIIAIPVGIASFYSVYADEPGLDSVAQRTACAEQKGQCRLHLTKLARMPWKRAFIYSGGGAKVQVDCTRTFVLVGDYRCARASQVQY
jgi:hypothetical protein